MLEHRAFSVARQCACRAIRFHAAVVAAGAVLAAVDQIHVPQLHALVHTAVEHMPAEDDAAAEPRAEREQHRRLAAAERACVKLCQRRAVCIVRQIHRHALERLLHQRLERHIVKAQVVGVDDALAGLVDAAGNDNADALELPARNVLLLQQEIDRFLDGFDHASRAVVREPDAAALQQLQRFAHKTDLDIGSADIHTNLIHVTHPPSRLRRAGQTAS